MAVVLSPPASLSVHDKTWLKTLFVSKVSLQNRRLVTAWPHAQPPYHHQSPVLPPLPTSAAITAITVITATTITTTPPPSQPSPPVRTNKRSSSVTCENRGSTLGVRYVSKSLLWGWVQTQDSSGQFHIRSPQGFLIRNCKRPWHRLPATPGADLKRSWRKNLPRASHSYKQHLQDMASARSSRKDIFEGISPRSPRNLLLRTCTRSCKDLFENVSKNCTRSSHKDILQGPLGRCQQEPHKSLS